MKHTAANPHMATTSTPRTTRVKEEPVSPSALPQPHPLPSKRTTSVKQNPPKLQIVNNPPPETSQNHQFHEPHPCFTDKMKELRNISASLCSFFLRYDELQTHLDFIRSKLPEQNLNTDLPPPQTLSPIVPKTLDDPATEATVPVLPNSESSSCLSEMESFCKSMSSRGLYNYILSHIQEIAKLRKEAQTALKLAPNPGKLVLECLAHGKDSPRDEEREASVLILEFFLLMGCKCDEVEAEVKEEAEVVAVEWWNRLITEGGVSKNGFTIDARALLLLVACFGIPSAFNDEDLRELIHASNSQQISESLGRSEVLLSRIPGIIDEMMKKQMVIEAVDIAYTFGLESRYPPRLCLQHFLRESRDTCVEKRKLASSAEAAVEASRKYLADLKSALKCLEDRKIDPFIPGWRIPNLISNLQIDIAHQNGKIILKAAKKREADEPKSSKKLTSQNVKRTRLNRDSCVDGKSSREGLTPKNALTGGIRGHNNTFPPFSSELHVLPAGPYPGPGVHGGMLVDGVSQVINKYDHPYGWHGDAQFRERLICPSYSEPAPLVGGQIGAMFIDNVGQVNNNCIQPYGLHGHPPLREMAIGHSYPEQAPGGVNGLCRAAPSMAGFGKLPNPSSIDTSKKRSDSDLYGFADTIL